MTVPSANECSPAGRELQMACLELSSYRHVFPLRQLNTLLYHVLYTQTPRNTEATRKYIIVIVVFT